MSEPTTPKKLTVTFKKAPDYKIYPATGSWGGPTPNGQILINFVVDHAAVPSYTTHDVGESGQFNLAVPSEITSSGDLNKEILCGVLLTPADALSIAAWLKANAEKLMSRGE